MNMTELHDDIFEEGVNHTENLMSGYERFFERERVGNRYITVEKFRRHGHISPTARLLLVEGLLGSIQTRGDEEKPSVYDVELTEGIINDIKDSLKVHTYENEDIPFHQEIEIGEGNTLLYTYYPCTNRKSFEELKEAFDLRFYDDIE